MEIERIVFFFFRFFLWLFRIEVHDACGSIYLSFETWGVAVENTDQSMPALLM